MSGVSAIVVRADIETSADLVDVIETFLSIAPPFQKQQFFAFLTGLAGGLKTTENAAPAAEETTP